MVQITISKRAAVIIAVSLVLVIPGVAGATHIFTDVVDSNVHAPGIEWVANAGVTSGCGDGSTYCPNDPVSRAQMGTFMHRLSGNAPAIAPSVAAASALNADHATTADSATTAGDADTLDGVDSVDLYTKAEADIAFVAYDGVIPSGTTVIGAWSAAPSTDATGSVGFSEITFPARAGAAIASGTANMAAGTTNGTDNDAACTGTSSAPTAPAGTICFYVGFQTGLTGLAGFVSNGDTSHGAAVRVTGGGAATNKYARGSWAYTAP